MLNGNEAAKAAHSLMDRSIGSNVPTNSPKAANREYKGSAVRGSKAEAAARAEKLRLARDRAFAKGITELDRN